MSVKAKSYVVPIVCTCVHTDTHIHTHTYAHTYAHTCVHTQTCTHIHTHICTHMRTHTNMYTYSHTQTCTHAHTQTCTHAHTQTCTQTCVFFHVVCHFCEHTFSSPGLTADLRSLNSVGAKSTGSGPYQAIPRIQGMYVLMWVLC